MQVVLTPEQMARADAAAIAAGAPGDTLMERAGRAVARAVLRTLGGAYGRRAVVVCGKGSNGGDGLVATRVLRERGVRVAVFRLAGGVDLQALDRELARAHVCVDAMYGTGFGGVLDGDAAEVAARFEAAGVPVVAVDVPSGVDGRTGEVRGTAVRAARTVCLAALKPGLVLEPGAAYAGEVELADIGIGADAGMVPGEAPIIVAEAVDVAAWLPRRRRDTHKWEVGGVFVVAGSNGMTGAAMLVSGAALRAGAGIVVCGLPGEAAARAAGSEVITTALSATLSGALDEAGGKEVLAQLDRFRSVALGPGLGTDERTVAAVRAVVLGARLPLVLDADGLNAVAADTALLVQREAPTVLTPHGGELARLVGAPLGADPVEAVRGLAARTRCVVLSKGSRTVVGDPDGRVAVNVTGGPALATAGTGDVLTGVIAALLARGVPAWEAAVAGAWLHGRAATLTHPVGMVAGDLLDALPRVLAALEV